MEEGPSSAGPEGPTVSRPPSPDDLTYETVLFKHVEQEGANEGRTPLSGDTIARPAFPFLGDAHAKVNNRNLHSQKSQAGVAKHGQRR